MQSERKKRVAALADIKLLVTAGAPAASEKADAPRISTHKNKGNHGGHPSKSQPRKAIHVPAPERQDKARPDDGSPATSATSTENDDALLFRRAMASVERINTSQRAVLPAHTLEAPDILRQRRRHASGVDRPAPAAALSDHFAPALPNLAEGWFLRAGHGPDVLKKLKSGKWPVQASLDLHGSTLEDARERLDRFLHACLTHSLRCVLVVHGKGYGSDEGEPVLKAAVRRWLAQLSDVIAYAESDPAHGGSGALQVLLKPQPR